MNPTIIENTCWWPEAIPPVEVYKDVPNSSLKIAFIGDERLFFGLRHEGHLLLLTEKNWKTTLSYGKPDLLIIEPCLETCTEDFRHAMLPHGSQNNLIEDIICLARKLKIPVVYWQTLDSRYDPLFKKLSAQCDLRYYADPESLTVARKNGLTAKILLPCVQPALHNRFHSSQSPPSYNIIFDGWKEIIWDQDIEEILLGIQELGLNIVDGRFRQWNVRKRYLGKLVSSLKGYLPQAILWKILRFCKVQVLLPSHEVSQTEQTFRALQALACGCQVVCLSESRPRSLLGECTVWKPIRENFSMPFSPS